MGGKYVYDQSEKLNQVTHTHRKKKKRIKKKEKRKKKSGHTFFIPFFKAIINTYKESSI